MKCYLVERYRPDWCEDYAMVVIAEDKLHAERCARISSDDFKTEQTITVKEIKLDKECVVLKANTGG